MVEHFQLALRIVNSHVLIFAVMSIIVGSVSLHFAFENANPGWPANSGVGVWAGAILMTTGVYGLVVGSIPVQNKMFNCWNILFVTFISVGLAAAIQMVIHPSALIFTCMENPVPDYCLVERDGIIAMAAAHITFGTVFLPMLFVNYFIYFRMAKFINRPVPLGHQELKRTAGYTG